MGTEFLGYRKGWFFIVLSHYIFKSFVRCGHNPILNYFKNSFLINNHDHQGYLDGLKLRRRCGSIWSRSSWGIRESYKPENLPTQNPLRLVTWEFTSEREGARRGQSWPSPPENRLRLSHSVKSTFYFCNALCLFCLRLAYKERVLLKNSTFLPWS